MTRPQFDTADALRKSLRHANVKVQDMADALGVTRFTVSNWINGNNQPNEATLRQWAAKTGVDFDWLKNPSSAPPVGEKS
jgi:transcriptional regulator with XRE-family HTH domain